MVPTRSRAFTKPFGCFCSAAIAMNFDNQRLEAVEFCPLIVAAGPKIGFQYRLRCMLCQGPDQLHRRASDPPRGSETAASIPEYVRQRFFDEVLRKERETKPLCQGHRKGCLACARRTRNDHNLALNVGHEGTISRCRNGNIGRAWPRLAVYPSPRANSLPLPSPLATARAQACRRRIGRHPAAAASARWWRIRCGSACQTCRHRRR